MAKVTLLSLKGEKVKDIKLNDEIFGIEQIGRASCRERV